jgi:hypothetical protein
VLAAFKGLFLQGAQGESAPQQPDSREQGYRRPFKYLSYVFEHPPSAATVEAIEALLPWNLKPVVVGV